MFDLVLLFDLCVLSGDFELSWQWFVLVVDSFGFLGCLFCAGFLGGFCASLFELWVSVSLRVGII